MGGISGDIALGMALGGALTLAVLFLMILIIGKALRRKDFRCEGRKDGLGG